MRPDPALYHPNDARRQTRPAPGVGAVAPRPRRVCRFVVRFLVASDEGDRTVPVAVESDALSVRALYDDARQILATVDPARAAGAQPVGYDVTDHGINAHEQADWDARYKHTHTPSGALRAGVT